MKKSFLLIAIAFALSGCVSNGEAIEVSITDSTCGSSTKGKTDTKLKYKKDDISMKWKSYVGENTEFRIELKPKKGFEGNQVEIAGISGTLPGGDNTPFAWLNIKKSAKEFMDADKKPILILCVPAEVPVGTEYKFDVHVEGIGKLDPRAAVTW
jgi:hypothetical protein